MKNWLNPFLPKKKSLLSWCVFFLFLSILLNIIFLLFFNNYYNYASESITIGSFLRMQNGLPFVSSLNEIPLHITAFSPYFHWFFKPFLFLIPNDPYWVSFLSRIILLVVLVSTFKNYYKIVFLIQKKHFLDSKETVLFPILLIYSYFSLTIISIRPDLFSFYFESLGLLFLIKYLFYSKNKYDPLLSIFFFSMGIIFKLNTVGILTGVCFYLLIKRKYRLLISYSLFPVLITLTSYVIANFLVGDTFREVILKSFINKTLPIQEVPIFFLNFSKDMIFLPFLIHFLSMVGLSYIYKKLNKELAVVLFLSMLFSFAIGFLGQFKVGASYNYLYGYYILSIIPVVFAFTYIQKDLIDSLSIIKKSFNFTIGFVLIFQATVVSKSIFLKWGNQYLNYPFQKAKDYIEENHPAAAIYSFEPSSSIHFFRHNQIGPWVESFLSITEGFNEAIPVIKENLIKPKEMIAIEVGSNCQLRPPTSKYFKKEVAHLKKLKAQFGKICIYSEN